QGHAGRVEVHEHGPAVRGPADAGELGVRLIGVVAHGVAGDGVDAAVRGDALHMLGADLLILAADDVTVRGDGDVVDIVQHGAVARLDEQLQHARLAGLVRLALARAGDVAHDLAVTADAARGAGEIEVVAGPVDAFAAREDRRARGVAAQGQVAVGAFDVIQIDPAHGQALALTPQDIVPVAGVAARLIDQGQGLKTAARLQTARVGRQVAVEEALARVLGHVDDAGARVDAGGLVLEAAHGADRRRIDQAGGARRHLEHPAVVLGQAILGPGHDLFAAEPRAPGGDAPGAVDRCAAQAEVLALGAAGPEVVDDGGRAAAQRSDRAGLIGIDAIDAGAVQVADQTMVGAPGAG